MRVTVPMMCVLGVLLRGEVSPCGVAIAEATGLRGATIYPLLRRLEQDGWVLSRMGNHKNTAGANETGAPRKYYELTEAGRTDALRAIDRFAAEAGKAWSDAQRIARLSGLELAP